MLDDETPTVPAEVTPDEGAAPVKKAAKKTAAKKTAAKKATAEKTTAKKAAAKKTTAKKAAAAEEQADSPAEAAAPADQPADKPAKKAAKKAARKVAKKAADKPAAEPDAASDEAAEDPKAARKAVASVLFQAPEAAAPVRTRKRAAAKSAAEPAKDSQEPTVGDTTAVVETADDAATDQVEDTADESGEEGGSRRRPRRRGGRRRRRNGSDDADASSDSGEDADDTEGEADETNGDNGSGDAGSRRRRRRRRAGDDNGSGGTDDDPENTVTRVRRTRNPEDEITALSGSTRLEAKKQRRREGREAGRRRAPIVSEAEFLARRESVDRVMVIRQRDDMTQIAVLEDKVLVEHYVARESQTSLIGNVYLGRVQNVLPSMEAAFIDIGKGRNAVLYAGEVNWTALGAKDGQPRKIESVLKSGQPVLVQVTKDPIGHKGARLTSQISLPGRFLVYVPDGTTSGISRKLPDTERNRLKTLLKEIVPDTAGVIVRTAAEGASEEELTKDVERLTARWSDIEKKVEAGQAPQLLYGEPDLTLKVVRDLFTEDFSSLVVEGDDAWDLVDGYVAHVAPELRERVRRFNPEDEGADVFASYRIDEQIAKGLDRKVWLPSGGSLIIDRTEAMTVIDVNTGKFTGSGGNLEETVTKNNLEAAEEIVRQLRLRDIGGIIVVDFIDMVLESNRDLVLRRLVECLGRDRTRHQVAEVTSLGLVQMTRKRIGTGLLEAFSEDCTHCKGRGVVVHDHPIEPSQKLVEPAPRGGRRTRGGRGRGTSAATPEPPAPSGPPSPKDVAAMARPENVDRPSADGLDEADLELLDAPEDRDDRDDLGSEVLDLEPLTDDADVEVSTTTPEPEPETQPELELETSPETGDAEPDSAPVEAPAPAVVTSSRRRARRPAGPPQHSAPEKVAQKVAQTATESSDVPVEEAPEIQDPAPSDDEPAHDEASILHVPVKRKGARRR